jgi:hypothetical protein
MKVPPILCAMLVCTALVWQAAAAQATDPNEDEHSPARQAARSRAVTGEDGSTKAERADDRQSPRMGSDRSVGPTGGNPGAADSRGRGSAAPQRGIGQLERTNADRLRSLLNAQARGRLAGQSGRGSVGSRRAAINGRTAAAGREGASQVSRPTPVASGPTAVASGPRGGASRPATVASGPTALASGSAAVASGPTAVASNSGVRAVAGPGAVTRAIGRGTAIGGPRPPGAGLLGGPASGRTAHSAMVDGTQFRHGH